ncbi:hypothetical protein ACJIZ3_015397 [Penstemon smallii]|uniref:Uncharacterized protein n=1 Tax=Penstemon smallii TaxID=265156 RepID=A0ABD3RMD1_9LAMI
MSLARSMAITPALQPIPPRLKVFMFPRSLYLFTIMAEREGVGLKRLQFTTRIPISFGLIPVALKRLSNAPNMTCYIKRFSNSSPLNYLLSFLTSSRDRRYGWDLMHCFRQVVSDNNAGGGAAGRSGGIGFFAYHLFYEFIKCKHACV